MRQGESRKSKVGSKYPDARVARQYINAIQHIALEAKKKPRDGYDKRIVTLAACDECEAGGYEVVRYELNTEDVATLLKACALLLPPARVTKRGAR